MSTQQQLNAWNAALAEKEQERADQATILKVQREEQAKAEDARINAELALQRAVARGAPDAETRELRRQVDQFDDAETDARLAAAKTEDNIGKLDGSIRYNRAQRDLYQGALPAQGTPASTVADRPANAAANAAQTAPAPVPAPAAAASVPPSQRGDNGGFVTNAQGELVPSDSAEAEEIRAEQNRIEARESAPQREFVIDPVTGEQVPSDSVRADEIRAEQNRVQPKAEAPRDFVTDPNTGELIPSDSDRAAEIRAEEAAAFRPEPVPPNVSVIQDENGTWGVWNDDEGRFIVEGLSQQEAQLQADEIAAGFGVQQRPFPPGALNTGPAPVPDNYTAISDPEGTPPNNWAVWNDTQGVYESRGLTQQEAQLRAENLSLGADEPIPQGTPGGTGLTEEEQRAKDEAAAKANAINQATRKSVYKQAGSSDWRVRLQLAPTSNYLYNQPEGQRGILDPLFYTNGVIFPYTPQIQTNYQARYTDYDLVHSNFRGVFYQSSRVDDINIRAEFTAQDTNEANYLLAVIHFFRSATKMFYGKDTERGTPPPLVYLSGLGMDQFYGHPCLVRQFQYALPNNVDYIRATNVNNYGTDLLTRRKASAPSSAAGLGATGNRILNAGLEKFFPAAKPAPNTVVAQVNNNQLANYVPTKMEIDIVLIPVQTRSQASKQFSLKGFANGNLIRNGFW
jgi:hypothetical protein